MAYSTIDRVRDLTGLTTDEISDESLQILLAKADNKVLNEINVRETNKELDNNTETGVYYIPDTPIADIDKDGEVTTDDITVYYWTDDGDISTRSEATVSYFDSTTGRLELSETGQEKYTADYSYYLASHPPDFDLVEDAVSYLAGYLAILRTRGKVPSKYKIGDLTIDDDDPGSVFRKEYRRVLRTLKTKMGM